MDDSCCKVASRAQTRLTEVAFKNSEQKHNGSITRGPGKTKMVASVCNFLDPKIPGDALSFALVDVGPEMRAQGKRASSQGLMILLRA